MRYIRYKYPKLHHPKCCTACFSISSVRYGASSRLTFDYAELKCLPNQNIMYCPGVDGKECKVNFIYDIKKRQRFTYGIKSYSSYFFWNLIYLITFKKIDKRFIRIYTPGFPLF